jgi:hypothetical protein
MQAVSIREKLATVPGIEPSSTYDSAATRTTMSPGLSSLSQTTAYVLHTYFMIATATYAGNTCTQAIEPAEPPLD